MDNWFWVNSIVSHHITTKYLAYSNSTTVVPYAKFHSDHIIITLMRAEWNILLIWITMEKIVHEMGPWSQLQQHLVTFKLLSHWLSMLVQMICHSIATHNGEVCYRTVSTNTSGSFHWTYVLTGICSVYWGTLITNAASYPWVLIHTALNACCHWLPPGSLQVVGTSDHHLKPFLFWMIFRLFWL